MWTCFGPKWTTFKFALTAYSEKLDEILSDLPTPVPIIIVIGDFNFTKETVKWIRNEEGLLFPIVANQREGETAGGKQDRLQARQLIDMACNHNLLQQGDQATHGIEILDLVFTNDSDLISNIIGGGPEELHKNDRWNE